MNPSLNRLVSIDYPVRSVDSTTGGETVTWSRLVLCWAEVQDVMPSKSETARQGMQEARNQTRVRLRWRNDVTPAMRVVVQADTDVAYQIVGGPAEIGGRKRYIELLCERYSTAGNG